MFCSSSHLALGAVLGVSAEPVVGLTVVSAFLQPQLQNAAVHRVVPLLRALEAEDVAAVADHWATFCQGCFDDAAAVRCRAPL